MQKITTFNLGIETNQSKKVHTKISYPRCGLAGFGGSTKSVYMCIKITRVSLSKKSLWYNSKGCKLILTGFLLSDEDFKYAF